mmetsp:Transcript_4967/g.13862  ORF Transcript_4967/g.13862 Transcript_4967/m.13862 type:complete len:295 (-) Transcript_4967:284-1168(-)
MSNGSRFLFTQLHEGIINLLDNFRFGIGSSITTFGFNLFLDPKVGLAQSITNLDGRFPSQFLQNQLVIGITSTNSHGTINMLNGEFLVLKTHGNLSKFNHIHHFGSTQVNGNITITKHETQDTLDTIINVGKGSSLLAITPHFKLGSGCQGLATKGCGSLFSSTLPGTTRTIDVVKSSNTNLHVKITSIGQGHFFRIQLFQSIHVLRTGWPSIRFNQTRIGGIFLLGFIIDTGRTGIKKVFDFIATSTLQHVHTNGSIVKGQDRFITHNKSHATHVRGQVVHVITTLTGLAGNL